MKKYGLLLALLFALYSCNGQDLNYVKYVVDTLCSPTMHGRGYVKKGDKIAAEFIQNEFKKNGASHFGESWLQPFEININTFPKEISLRVDNKTLIPGTDWIVSCSSPGIKGTYNLFYLPESYDSSSQITTDVSELFIVATKDQKKLLFENPLSARGIMFLSEDPLWWHVSNGRSVGTIPILNILKDQFPKNASSVTLNIKNKFREGYKTQNVIAFIEGKSNPEKFIVFTAHYDHLGRMGSKTYYPGAHDNASGTAMILDLAKYYALPENQPDFSMAFIAFSAEELGLFGSEYYSKHPLFPLKNIHFLINLDMVSTGVDGIMVVNGRVLEDEFKTLVEINDNNALLKEVKSRGTARNSDHYYFYKNGVPSFFIYTLGDYPYYHRPEDLPENLPFTEYNDLFVLMTKFAEALEN